MRVEQRTFLGTGRVKCYGGVGAELWLKCKFVLRLILLFCHSKVSKSAKFLAVICSLGVRMHITENQIQSTYHDAFN